jgi:hypothetical protein
VIREGLPPLSVRAIGGGPARALLERAIATNNNVTLSPSSMGSTTNNWIGRSQYADPPLQAEVDDFQIHDRALSQAEIEALMAAPGGGNVISYQFDEADGRTVLDSSGAGRHATVETDLEFVGDWSGKVFHITRGMYRRPLEWLTWVQYVDGDNRLPRFSETSSQPWSCHFAFALLSLPRSACTDLNSYCRLSAACRLPVGALASSCLSGAPCGAGGGGGGGDAWGVSYAPRGRTVARQAPCPSGSRRSCAGR